METKSRPLHVEIDSEKKKRFQILCVEKDVAMSDVISCLIDDVLDGKWDKFECAKGR